MSAAPFLFVGALALGLSGAVAWELMGPVEAARGPGPARAADVRAEPVAAPPVDAAGDVAAILARPLFSPGRRPLAPNVVAEATPAAAALPRLTGVLVTGAGKSAIFAAQPRATVVGEGGRLGRFTVRSIEPGRVVVIGPDGARTVEPSFDPSRPVPAAAAPRPQLGLPLLAPGAFPPLQEGAKDAMPFNQVPTPSGLAILRNAATQAKNGTPSGR